MEKGIVVADTGNKDAALLQLSHDAAHGLFQGFSRQHMGQSVIHADDDGELLSESLRQLAKVGAGKIDGDTVALCAHFCLGEFTFTDVRGSDGIAHRGKADGLRTDAAGAIEDGCSGVKSLCAEQRIENHRLLLRSGLPIKKQLVVLGGQTVVKSLGNVHVTLLIRWYTDFPCCHSSRR